MNPIKLILNELRNKDKCDHDWVFVGHPCPALIRWKCTKCQKEAWDPDQDKGIRKLIAKCPEHEYVRENIMVMDAYFYHCKKCGKPRVEPL